MWPFKRRPSKAEAAAVEAAVLPHSGDVTLRYPGEGVPRIISAQTAAAIADAVLLHRRIAAAERGDAPGGAGA